VFHLASIRISTVTESRAHQVSTLTTETRRHRSRRRRALVFRFRPNAQSRYFPCSSAFDHRSDRGSYKETFSICPCSLSPICPLLFRHGILYFSLFSTYLFSNERQAPHSGNKRSRKRGKPQSGNTLGDVVNIGKLEIG